MTTPLQGKSQCPAGYEYIPAGISREHEVPAFCMKKAEVTNGEFVDEAVANAERVIGRELSLEEAMAYSPSPKGLNGLLQPVTGVRKRDAKAYCKAHGGELPTIDQWRRAVSGKSGNDPFPTANGKLSHDQATYSDKPIDDADKPKQVHATTNVCTYAPNSFGICDLVGNVQEWIGDSVWGSGLDTVVGGSWQEVWGRDNIFSTQSGINSNEVGIQRRGEVGVLGEDVGFRCVTSPIEVEE